jgi:DNA-binding NtrC family response regulator
VPKCGPVTHEGPTLRAELFGGTQQARTFRLLVREGPEAGQSLDIDPDQPGPWLVGQSESCHLRLSDRHVSRRHAEVQHLGASLRYSDAKSLNGSRVDGVWVESCLLRGGERLRLGDTTIEVVGKDNSNRPHPSGATGFGEALGISPEMRRLYPLLARLAASTVPVLLEGETGSGKEAVAHAIHQASPRAKGPFVVFDCTCTPTSLFESELLGHEKGAFTGAQQQRRGCFEMAHGGTLFIDELGDLELPLQAKLLRAVEAKQLRRVGGDREYRVDVRLVCATRRDLDREVQLGRFREDLFYRLAVSRVLLPALRHRRGDIRFLTLAFWQQLGGDAAGPPGALLDKWEDGQWPGNVRELKNAVARALALGDDLNDRPAATTAAVPDSIDGWAESAVTQRLALSDARDWVVRAFEKAYVDRLSRVHPDDAEAVAQQAGVTRRYLNMLKQKLKGGG